MSAGVETTRGRPRSRARRPRPRPPLRRVHCARLLQPRGRGPASSSPWSVPTGPGRRPSSPWPPACWSRPRARSRSPAQEAGTIPARRALSYLPDAPVFYEDLSFGEHLAYVAALHGVADAGARGSTQLLERLGLGEWEDSLAVRIQPRHAPEGLDRDRPGAAVLGPARRRALRRPRSAQPRCALRAAGRGPAGRRRGRRLDPPSGRDRRRQPLRRGFATAASPTTAPPRPRRSPNSSSARRRSAG